jgi:flagellar hook-basal body complex protein FliE
MLSMASAVSAVSGNATAAVGVSSLLESTRGEAATGQPFADLISDSVGQVDALDKQASTAVTGLMTGAGVDVHQAMIATEKADMAFELALAVRNKAVQAYQSVMGMQF